MGLPQNIEVLRAKLSNQSFLLGSSSICCMRDERAVPQKVPDIIDSGEEAVARETGGSAKAMTRARAPDARATYREMQAYFRAACRADPRRAQAGDSE